VAQRGKGKAKGGSLAQRGLQSAQLLGHFRQKKAVMIDWGAGGMRNQMTDYGPFADCPL
jgi:hypothetical protein